MQLARFLLGTSAVFPRTGGKRDLPKLAGDPMPPALDPVKECASLCGKGYKYLGMQDGVQCLCGNTYGSQGRASSTCCAMGCAVRSQAVKKIYERTFFLRLVACDSRATCRYLAAGTTAILSGPTRSTERTLKSEGNGCCARAVIM